MKLVCRKISGRKKAFWYIGRGGRGDSREYMVRKHDGGEQQLEVDV
jgi:hypothetical protein